MNNKAILLVDDEPAILTSVGWALEKHNFDVTTAADGVQAIEALRTKSFDLVITDLKMPEMSGLEVLRQAKAMRPEIGVFILTGYGDIDSAIQSLQLGADDYLLKPCDLDELLRKAERSFERQKLLVQLQLQNDQLKLEIESRKIAEVQLQHARDGLEQLVASRTEELTKTVEHLNNAITTLAKREQDLQEKNQELSDINTTLNTLLKRRNHEHKAIRAEIADKTAKTVLPLLEKAQQQSSGSTWECMETARINLLDIFTNNSQEALITTKLAPRELEVIHYIKQKKTSKEIAELLNLSVRTIEYYRKISEKNSGWLNRIKISASSSNPLLDTVTNYRSAAAKCRIASSRITLYFPINPIRKY